MKDIDGVLTDFDSMLHFVNCDNDAGDCKHIWKLDSYKTSMRRHLYAMIPSVLFIISLSLMILTFFVYSPDVKKEFGFLIIVAVLIFAMFIFILMDFDRYRLKHDKFISGDVVGKTRDKKGFITNYYLIFLLSCGELIAANVSKKDYVNAKPNKKFWIFLDVDGLFAIKS